MKLPRCIFFLGAIMLAVQPARSAQVDTKSISASLVPDKATVMLGEPTYLSFTIRNNSATDLRIFAENIDRGETGPPDGYQLTVLDAKGKQVSYSDSRMWPTDGIVSAEKLPAHGTFSFSFFVTLFTTLDKPGTYTFKTEGKLKLEVDTPHPDSASKADAIDLPVEARTILTVIPEDQAALGRLIDELGTQMNSNRKVPNARDATQQLQAINDERVIPYFLVKVRSHDYGSIFDALPALGRFNNDEVLQAVEALMNTKSDDLSDVETKNVRHAAAVTLDEMPNPKALPFLLGYANDPDPTIRIDIIHALHDKAKTTTDAIPRLKEMAHDKDPTVRGEAEFELQALGEKSHAT